MNQPVESWAPVPTPEQQAVLERIAAQRERLRARRAARQQAVQAAAAAGGEADAPWLARALVLVRQHPGAAAIAAGAALTVGPRRLLRWASVVLPLVLRARR